MQERSEENSWIIRNEHNEVLLQSSLTIAQVDDENFCVISTSLPSGVVGGGWNAHCLTCYFISFRVVPSRDQLWIRFVCWIELVLLFRLLVLVLVVPVSIGAKVWSRPRRSRKFVKSWNTFISKLSFRVLTLALDLLVWLRMWLKLHNMADWLSHVWLHSAKVCNLKLGLGRWCSLHQQTMTFFWKVTLMRQIGLSLCWPELLLLRSRVEILITELSESFSWYKCEVGDGWLYKLISNGVVLIVPTAIATPDASFCYRVVFVLISGIKRICRVEEIDFVRCAETCGRVELGRGSSVSIAPAHAGIQSWTMPLHFRSGTTSFWDHRLGHSDLSCPWLLSASGCASLVNEFGGLCRVADEAPSDFESNPAVVVAIGHAGCCIFIESPVCYSNSVGKWRCAQYTIHSLLSWRHSVVRNHWSHKSWYRFRILWDFFIGLFHWIFKCMSVHFFVFHDRNHCDWHCPKAFSPVSARRSPSCRPSGLLNFAWWNNFLDWFKISFFDSLSPFAWMVFISRAMLRLCRLVVGERPASSEMLSSCLI